MSFLSACVCCFVFADQFQVEILRDPVYGSPVYRLVAGQTRCGWEGHNADGSVATVSRDMIELTLAQSAFVHVNPTESINTVLTMTNLSPTGESFAYQLTLAEETDHFGLVLSINGITLSTSPLTFKLAYQQDLQVTLDVARGSNGYNFPNIQLILTGTGMATEKGYFGTCVSTTATLSVQYDEPCGAVHFAGPLASTPTFLVNAAEVANLGGVAALSITIRNPEYSLKGRHWLELASKGFLTAINIEYRSANAPAGQVLSELDWTNVPVVGSSDPLDVLASLNAEYLSTASTSNDFFNVLFDLSSLSDGAYQLRAMTQCQVPAGALDTSLYTQYTNIVQGTLDVTPPTTFGEVQPAPGSAGFLPGQPISVTFTKAINCQSYFGEARAQVWMNPESVALGQAQGVAVASTFICSGNTITVALVAPGQ